MRLIQMNAKKDYADVDIKRTSFHRTRSGVRNDPHRSTRRSRNAVFPRLAR
jgi:hypothetical protein